MEPEAGDSGIAVVLSTCPAERAQELGRLMVERRLAACVNIVPQIQSIYWWEGKICEDGESLLIFKTSRAGVDRLLQALRSGHPYQVPEFLALPVFSGNEAYLQWVRDATRQGG